MKRLLLFFLSSLISLAANATSYVGERKCLSGSPPHDTADNSSFTMQLADSAAKFSFSFTNEQTEAQCNQDIYGTVVNSEVVLNISSYVCDDGTSSLGKLLQPLILKPSGDLFILSVSGFGEGGVCMKGDTMQITFTPVK